MGLIGGFRRRNFLWTCIWTERPNLKGGPSHLIPVSPHLRSERRARLDGAATDDKQEPGHPGRVSDELF